MGKNDDKIKVLMSKLEEMKKELGDRPKFILYTNGLFKYNDKDHFNINTVHEITVLINSTSFLMVANSYYMEAQKLLGVSGYSFMWNGFTFDEWITDFKNRTKMILWDQEKKKFDALQKKLDSLISEELRTEVELDSIEKMLKSR